MEDDFFRKSLIVDLFNNNEEYKIPVTKEDKSTKVDKKLELKTDENQKKQTIIKGEQPKANKPKTKVIKDKERTPPTLHGITQGCTGIFPTGHGAQSLGSMQ